MEFIFATFFFDPEPRTTEKLGEFKLIPGSRRRKEDSIPHGKTWPSTHFPPLPTLVTDAILQDGLPVQVCSLSATAYATLKGSRVTNPSLNYSRASVAILRTSYIIHNPNSSKKRTVEDLPIMKYYTVLYTRQERH